MVPTRHGASGPPAARDAGVVNKTEPGNALLLPCLVMEQPQRREVATLLPVHNV